MKKLFNRVVDGSVALVNRFLPDAFVLAIILTIIVFIIAIPVTGVAPAEGVSVFDRFVNLIYDGWLGGFWDLLAFSMQMALIVVTGSVFANAPPIHRFIVCIASVAKTPKQAVLLVALIGMITYFIQWGAAMIICAILAKEVAKRVKGVHYPLLVAAAYLGNGLWHGGISGTIPLNLAGGWTFEGMWSTTGIPFSQTVFAPYNLFIYIVGAIVLCLLITAITLRRTKLLRSTLPLWRRMKLRNRHSRPSQRCPLPNGLKTLACLTGLLSLLASCASCGVLWTCSGFRKRDFPCPLIW